jgi:hypothetical protein
MSSSHCVIAASTLRRNARKLAAMKVVVKHSPSAGVLFHNTPGVSGMFARFSPLVAVLVVVSAAPAAPPEIPYGLTVVPADAAFFAHVNVADLLAGKLGDSFKKAKSDELKAKLASITADTGLTLADVKTYTFAVPNLQSALDGVRQVAVVTFSKKYDREKYLASLKKEAEAKKGKFSEKDGIARVTTPSPFDAKNEMETITDLTDPQRIVTAVGLKDDAIKPKHVTGLHAEAIKQHAAAPFLMGVNCNALPEELKGDNLPAEARPFKPIILADGITVVGTQRKDELTLSIAVKSKQAKDAAEVEKSLDAFRTFLGAYLASAKKDTANYSKPKEIAALFDAAADALKRVTFKVDDKTATATATMPLDADLSPLVEYAFGGGLSGRSQSQNNLKQLALAMYNYESAYGTYPAPASLGKKGKKLLSWRVEVLPYIEQEQLYKQFNLDEAWDSEHNLKVMKDNPMPKVFAVPGTTNATDKKTHYQVFVGTGAMFDLTGPLKITEVKDGTSNTFLIATAATAVEWTKPDDIDFDPKGEVQEKLLFMDGVTMVAMGDASVRALSAKVKEKTLKAMVTRSGGETLDADEK